MTRADFPAWRLPFPTLPTISGRRPASRRERKRLWCEIRQSNWRRPCGLTLEALVKRWVDATVPRQGSEHMALHVKIMAMTPDEAATYDGD